jgi:hypothetical protein
VIWAWGSFPQTLAFRAPEANAGIVPLDNHLKSIKIVKSDQKSRTFNSLFWGDQRATGGRPLAVCLGNKMKFN